jgi:regulator of protease activity HflC (stomatin/prohibitin superfamily)
VQDSSVLVGVFVLVVGGLFVLIVLVGSFFTVNTANRAIVERFSKFSRVALPGFQMKIPLFETVHMITTRVQTLAMNMETKTKDNVFVKIPVSVQYQVMPGSERDAFYKLSNPQSQIESYVFNVLLGHVPSMTLDETFAKMSTIAEAVKSEVEPVAQSFGYTIVKVLVTDIIPDQKVKDAMNDINAAAREREAAESRGETDKIIAIKKAEAESQSKKLQGEGIANQRKAIIEGLRESVEAFKESVPGTTAQDVMRLVLMTQYFDTIKEIGASAKTNTILLPHGPGTVNDLTEQIREAIMTGSIATQAQKP